MKVKLKPCPFCGGKGRVRRLKEGYRIVCEECGASSHYVFIQRWHDSKSVAQCQAAKAWNSRIASRFGPCDFCMYSPPSSADGKPCSMCPACAISDS